MCIRDSINHIYHDFHTEGASNAEKALARVIEEQYAGEPDGILQFGAPRTLNTNIYSVKIFGDKEFRTSITLVHEFFGTFRVTSMLSRSRDIPIGQLVN